MNSQPERLSSSRPCQPANGFAALALGAAILVLPLVLAAQNQSALAGGPPSVPSVAPPRSPTVGVVLVAHGADAGWNSRLDSLAAMLRAAGQIDGPVVVSFLMGPAAASSRFQDMVASVSRAGVSCVVVVPLLVSSHSGHYEQIRYLAGKTDSLDAEMQHHLHMSGLARARSDIPLVVTPALDDAPELAHTIAKRARSMVPSPTGRALFLLGHGPNSAEDYAAWMKSLRAVADTVRAITGFASVAVELVRDDAPAAVRAEAVLRAREIVSLQRAATGADVAVVPLLVSRGDVSRRKLPSDLAGLPVIYDGAPILPSIEIARWVERRVRVATEQSQNCRR